MKKIFLLLFLILLLPSSSRTGDGFECPWGECRELLVSSENDIGDGTLRAAVTHACDTPGDEVIKFIIWKPVYLETQVIVPSDCKGHVYILGKKQVRNVLDGSKFGSLVEPGNSACLLWIESDGNYVEYLSLVGLQTGGEDESTAGIGLCLFGNYNVIKNSSFGVLEGEDGKHGNDLGIGIAGEYNQITNNHISQNTLDGILIHGSRNEIYGNFIGRPYEDCALTESFALSKEKSEAVLPAVVVQDSSSEQVSVENNESPEVVANRPAANPQPMRVGGGCSLVTEVSEKSLTQTLCPLVSNGRYGIYINNGNDNRIGNRDVPGFHNVIQHNGGGGVYVNGSANPARNQISANVFYRNHGLGIDLGKKGVNKNDKGDADSGSNGLMNYPESLQASLRTSRDGGDFPYYFALSGQAEVGTLIELYLADGGKDAEPLDKQGDESGFGEGEFFINSFVVNENPFLISLSPRISRGVKLTMLAFDPQGNTSEFSKDIVLEQDTDRDGIFDSVEEGDKNSSPYDPDTDKDGLMDSFEDTNLNGKRDKGETFPRLLDSDEDGLSDYIETRGDGNYDVAKGDTNPLNLDTDCDGLLDGEEDGNYNGIAEFKSGETDPKRGDSDGDAIKDGGGCEPAHPQPIDNCPTIANPDQLDANGNGVGDVCEIP